MRKPQVMVIKAPLEFDPYICDIAKKSRYTRDFATHRFFRDDIENTYLKGEVGVALLEGGKPHPIRDAGIAGFVYVKHLRVKSRPQSVVHFMGVAESAKNKGIGRKLLAWALETSPHGYVELSCEHTNAEGMKFYEACGFERIREGVYGDKNPRPYTRFGKRR